MKQIVIISGKGGTGKTVLTASFAALAKDIVISDCDVDAADLHLILSPFIRERGEFSGGVRVEIDQDKCTGCGKCEEACQFSAIKKETVDGKLRFFVDPVAVRGVVCAILYVRMGP